MSQQSIHSGFIDKIFTVILILGCFMTSFPNPTHASNPPSISDHFDGDRFYNPNHKETKGFWEFLKWQMTKDKSTWPTWLDNEISFGNSSAPLSPPLRPNESRVTWVNHSTFLIQFANNLNILTDPVYSDRVSPVTFAGPKRVHAPGIPFEKLPKIQGVLISHNHYDHLDLPTLKALNDRHRPQFFVGLGVKKLLVDSGIENVIEMDWNQKAMLTPHTSITFLECQHWSARGLFDRFKTLWGAFMIEHEFEAVEQKKFLRSKIYFAGDTGYASHFIKTHMKFHPIDIALLPIGAYEPRWFMKNFHMNPEDALKAAKDLQSTHNIGMHFGTFQLTDEGIDDPVNTLKKLLLEKYSDVNFKTLKAGEQFQFLK